MIVAAFDPSSTCTGYALLRSAQLPGGVLEAGVIKPSSPRAAPLRRAWEMGGDVVKLLNCTGRAETLIVVIEIPAPQVRGKRRLRHGQATYGMAVGAIATMIELEYGPVFTVRADEWTRRPKAVRARELAAAVPGYDARKDKGMDCADAVELGVWWWTQIDVKRKAAVHD